ncbi:MAG: CDP-diacylglycerol--glycerol-3-phosphate 3-phosphatidyltransferase [Candidatus Peribacteraceae bacterium]|nr:CDP-diacylglycerol--glycerol-3-phosphate 3-phosphatidyltransferase [Candidatus Peribacteraceae bacterium]
MRKKLPNIITLSRLLATIAIAVLFFVEIKFQFEIILALFWFAALTDFFDGYLARRWKVESKFGKVFDSLFDKVLTLTLYLLLAPFLILPVWIFVLLLVRELIVDGLKNFSLSRQRPVAPLFSGKLKMVFQILMLNFALLVLIFPNEKILLMLAQIFAALAIITAYFSGVIYLKNFFKQ